MIVGWATVQVKNKFGLRTKTIQVLQANFIDEAESNLLGGALDQWKLGAEDLVAGGALRMRVAEHRVKHAIYGFVALPRYCASCLGKLHRDCHLANVCC